ncbi:hypothetical protein ABPG72_003056 [Tetrahymena utriculariae]
MRQIKIHQNNESLKLFQLTEQEIQNLQIKNTFNLFETIKQQKKINNYYEIYWSQKKVILRDIDSSYIIQEYEIKSIYQIGDEFASDITQDYQEEKQINFLFDLHCKSIYNQDTKNKDFQLVLSTFDCQTFFYCSIDQRILQNKQNQLDEFQNGQKNTFFIGKIDSSIQNQYFLEKLKQIEDVIQLQLHFKAYSLKYIDLQNLLEQFSQQQNLSQINLNISFNIFSQNELINLGDMIKKYQNLNSLKLILEEITLNGQGDISDLFIKIAENTKIQILDLDLEYNHLNQAQAQKICQEISRFPSLKILKLDLDQNQLNSDYRIGLFETLSSIKSLIELDISLEYNQLCSDSFLSQKFQSLGNLGSLEALSISLGANFISESAAQSIKECVSKLQGLKKLSLILQYLEMQENGIITVLKGVNECINLEYLKLDLQNNQVGQQSIWQLCGIITGLQKLISLDLDLGFTQINFQDALTLSKAIKNHKKFIYIKFILSLKNQNQRYMIKRNLQKILRLAKSKIILL